MINTQEPSQASGVRPFLPDKVKNGNLSVDVPTCKRRQMGIPYRKTLASLKEET
jgi:hypothetical protein